MRKFLNTFCVACLFLVAIPSSGNNKVVNQKICVSKNHRFLTYEDGKPFFYLADTAWELFHRLKREEVDYYLQNRKGLGFTAIQAVVLAELDGLGSGNAYGYLPFKNEDPTMPDVKDGEANDYWDMVDYVVNRANEYGLCMAMLPTWGCFWHDGDCPVFNVKNAEVYGHWLAERYRDKNVIWILGGDRNPENEAQKEIVRALAKGLKAGDGGKHLITYHPGGSWGSGDFFHEEDWLDFNMRQNGHDNVYHIYGKTLDDYQRMPTKPVIDGEPIYEDHPIAFNPERFGHSVAADCRRALYWDLFNGACGHTYGHHSVWQMFEKGKRQPVNRPLLNWREALGQPGAKEMVYGKNLMLSRPYFSRIPASDKIIIASEVETAMPGRGRNHFVATGDEDGSFLMVYAPIGRKFKVRTSFIRGNRLKIWWYNPRNGEVTCVGCSNNQEEMEFISPDKGETLDWILVIDDASKSYPRPGKPLKEFQGI